MSSEKKLGITVINAGSSSIKVSVFEVGNNSDENSNPLALFIHAEVNGINTDAPELRVKKADSSRDSVTSLDAEDAADHGRAYGILRENISKHLSHIELIAVGHRIVHGGKYYNKPVIITPEVKKTIKSLTSLAPLHQPSALAGIEAIESHAPHILQVAGFDTSFHHDRGVLTQMTGLPWHFYQQGLMRYGFHGLSYEYIAQMLSRHWPELFEQRVIVAHLGNGASLCAMQNGKSINTTMSLTPLDGIPMGSRSGSLDPGLLLYLLTKGMEINDLRKLLYYESGLKGISQYTSDMQELLKKGDKQSRLAIDFFVFRIAEEFSRMTVAMKGVDALIFTGGIGEHAPVIRQQVCQHLAPVFGLDIDEEINESLVQPIISTAESGCKVMVIPTDEEGMLAQHVWNIWHQHEKAS